MKANILKENILSNNWGKYSEYTIEYTRSDGKTEIQKREIQDNGNGASILLYDLSRRSVILIKQFRLATLINGHQTGVIIECVAGLVEQGEDAHKAIIREVMEETGLLISNPTYIYSAFSTPGVKTEKIALFTAEYKGPFTAKKNRIKENEQEDIEVLELPFSAAVAQIKSGEIQDAKTIMLLQYAQLYIFTP